MDTMDEIIIGDVNCTFNTLIGVMSKSPVFDEMVRKEWTKIGLGLDMDSETKNGIEHALLYDKSFLPINIMEQLLTAWRCRKDTGATLGLLCKILSDKGFNDFVTQITNWFEGQVATVINDDDSVAEADANDPVAHLVDHLQYYIVDLMEAAHLSRDLLKKFKQNSIISQDEVDRLESLRNKEDRNRKFFKLVQNKIRDSGKDSLYHSMLQIFSEDARNGKNVVTLILRKAFD